MDEIKRAKNVILFIDEMHTIVGAGAAEGAMDASNILKPALSRGEIQCVGATTLAEYRKHIEKDAALERRFQSVKVDDPSPDDAILILRGIRSKYEDHHKCEYTDAAIEAAVRLSHRYITARHLPDKAIDVMDEAGARARIRSLNLPPELDAAQADIDRVVLEKEEASRHQKFEEAANLRDQEKKLRAKREKMLEEWRKKRDEKRIVVTEDEMLHIVADWTGVPLNRLEKKETQKLLDLEQDLQKAVIGQERACEVIARALRRSRADLKDPRRPIGFLPLPRPHRRRQDAAGPLARGTHVRRVRGGHPDRHVRVHGEVHGLPPHRLAARLRRPRRRRPAHRAGAPQALLRRPLRRDREGPPRRHPTSCSRRSRTAA